MTVKQLIKKLMKYHPDAEIRYLTNSALGIPLKLQHHMSCVYISDKCGESKLSNEKDSPVLIKPLVIE